MHVGCRFIGAFLIVAAVSLGSAYGDIVVNFDPVNSSIPAVGGTTLVNVVAEIPVNEPVLGWGIDLTLGNPAIASWTIDSFGPQWSSGTSLDGDGLAGLHFPPPGVTGSVLLVTLQFTGLSEGLTSLTLSDSYPADLSEGFALDPTGFAVVHYNPGTLRVLPEPATLTLLALAGLVALRRR